MTHSNILTNTLAVIDASNKATPATEMVDGSKISKELIYEQRISLELDLFEP